MRIYNGLGHGVAFYKPHQTTYDKSKRKRYLNSVFEEPYLFLEKMKPLNINIKSKFHKVIGESKIPLYTKSIIGFDPLPEGWDYYIVSLSYYYNAHEIIKEIYPEKKIVTISDGVYNSTFDSLLGTIGIVELNTK